MTYHAVLYQSHTTSVAYGLIVSECHLPPLYTESTPAYFLKVVGNIYDTLEDAREEMLQEFMQALGELPQQQPLNVADVATPVFNLLEVWTLPLTT